MILTGDLAVPSQNHSRQLEQVFEKYSTIFQNKILICNFEGLINEQQFKLNEPILYNHPSVIESLVKRGPVVAALANNHIIDLPGQFDNTIKSFKYNKIFFAGAGRSRSEAEMPVIFNEDGKEIILLNACWDFLLYNHKNPTMGLYVAEIKEDKLINSVTNLRKERNNAAIIVFLHWNFDLETLPFPMHRQFARSLIDAGANIVVGSHSHCVQGGEKYNDGYIIYGLGNFFIPNNVFANGKLSFPSQANLELVFEYDISNNKSICHWFEYQKMGLNHSLNYLESSDFETSERLKLVTPYQGMNEKEYIKYFKTYRRKKFLIPVFENYRKIKLNSLYTYGLSKRARFARFLAKKGIIKWQN